MEVRDEVALDFLAGLIDPNPALRARIRVSAASVLSSFERGDLFEFALAIACALTTPPGFRSKTLSRPFTAKEYARFMPNVLARAGRALIDWPHTIQEIASEVRECAHQREGHFGIQKELGPVLSITTDIHVHPTLRKILRDELDANLKASAAMLPRVRRAENRHRDDLVTMQAAAALLGCTRKFLARHLVGHPQLTIIKVASGKGPTLFRASELEQVFSLWGKLEPASSAAVALGIPTSAVTDLAEAGLLNEEKGPIVSCLVGTAYYHKETLESLIARILGMVLPGEPPESAIRITVGINRLGNAEDACWPAVFQSILSGKMAVWRRSRRVSAVMTSLAVEHITRLAEFVPGNDGVKISAEEVRLVQTEAALMSSEDTKTIRAAVSYGLLSKRPTAAEVRLFAAKYVSTQALRRELGRGGVPPTTKILRELLASQGVRPAIHHPDGRCFLWPRSSIDVDGLRCTVLQTFPRKAI